MRSQIFKFKQFEVDQAGCAMKINTDGVLLGALAAATNPMAVLDIGTGTGVIALMLAQKFAHAHITALDIDAQAAATAQKNFVNSCFAVRLKAQATSFTAYFEAQPALVFDLIVSNPPFYINALASPRAGVNLAKHTNVLFFEQMLSGVSKHLAAQGSCWLILPVPLAQTVIELALAYKLYVQKIITIRSFMDDDAHRQIIVFGHHEVAISTDNLVIYDAPKQYSHRYAEILKDFFIIF